MNYHPLQGEYSTDEGVVVKVVTPAGLEISRSNVWLENCKRSVVFAF
jgi:hypothetical protein